MKIDKRTSAILSLIFGVLILVEPSILSWLVAAYLIINGLLELAKK